MASFQSTAADRRDDQIAVDMAILGKFYARFPTGLAINLICSIGTVAALWPEQPVGMLLAWSGLMLSWSWR